MRRAVHFLPLLIALLGFGLACRDFAAPATADLTLLGAGPSAVGAGGGGGGGARNYLGRETISGISDFTPKIVCNRTTAVVPALVHVSAEETTGDAGVWTEYHYEWDFGDSGGSETATDYGSTDTYGDETADGHNLNVQYGPNAFYVYRTPGTYTITLTVKGQDGSIVSETTTTLNTQARYYTYLGGATGGTYTLSDGTDTTSAIAFDADGATVQAELIADISAFDADNCRVLVDETIQFFGDLSGTDVSLSLGSGSLTGTTGTPEIRKEQSGSSVSQFTAGADTGWTHRYCDSAASGANDGTSEADAWTDIADGMSFLDGGNNRVLHLAKGSSWTGVASTFFNAHYKGKRILGDTGSGAKPSVSGGLWCYFPMEWGDSGQTERSAATS